MPALTPTQAALLTQDPVAKGLIEQLPRPVPILKVFPFMKVEGAQLRVGTVAAALTPATGLVPSDVLPDDTETPAAYGPHVMGYLNTGYYLTFQAMDGFTFPNEQESDQSDLAVQRLLYGFCASMENASGSVYPNYQGIPGLLNGHSGQVLTPGGAFAISHVYAGWKLIKSNNGRPNAIMSTTAAQLEYIQAMIAAGIGLEYTDVWWDDPKEGLVKVEILSVMGTPWFVNDAMSNSKRIYFMVLGFGESGTTARGLTAIIPAGMKGYKNSMFVRRQLPATVDITSQGPPVTAGILSQEYVNWGWPVGLACGAPGALSYYEWV